jgi:hypothetical protein
MVESHPRARRQDPRLLAVRGRLATLLAALAVVLLIAGAWEDVPRSWDLLRTQHDTFAGYTRKQRDEAFGTLIPIRMDIFDFWKAYLEPHDRYWIQIPNEAFSTDADKRTLVRYISHIYLLPATEARSLSDATVVLSWDDDPGLLHLHFIGQARAGLQLIYVSRLRDGY